MHLRRGFTAIELTIVVALVAILSAIAMPGMTRLLDRIRVHAAVTQIESTFAAARHIAIARSSQASVYIDTVARVISISVGDDTLRRAGIGNENGVELGTNRSSMSYAATGIGYGAANLSVVVRKSAAVDTIVVSRLGRVRH